MRVIAGTCKGRRLTAVPGQNTRPTTDKVKESMFNIIGPYFDGGNVLDLFAGTGALGIEALSRGAASAVFIDKNDRAFSIVRRNVEDCRFTEQSLFLRLDAKKALSVLAEKDMRFDYVFLDPPYRLHIVPELITHMLDLQLLSPDAVIVAETEADEEGEIFADQLELFRNNRYGDTMVRFFRKRS